RRRISGRLLGAAALLVVLAGIASVAALSSRSGSRAAPAPVAAAESTPEFRAPTLRVIVDPDPVVALPEPERMLANTEALVEAAEPQMPIPQEAVQGPPLSEKPA